MNPEQRLGAADVAAGDRGSHSDAFGSQGMEGMPAANSAAGSTATAPRGRMYPDMATINAMSIEVLERTLDSVDHYKRTVTRNYGDNDPIRGTAQHLFRCTCGGRAVMHSGTPSAEHQRAHRPLPSDARGPAYWVGCEECSDLGPPSLREWRATIDWNYAHAQGQQGSLEGFPFFNLGGLCGLEAKRRLYSIRCDMSLRSALARKQRERGEVVGGGFVTRLEAYLGWVHVALKVLASAPRPP